ncbi:MAG: MFS transporter [Deltaproteobacteria bacterium]|nr:MFS transporter [Deltaproteobacteria bacterium]
MSTPAVESSAATWTFPRAFWVANVIELFERAAYYGTFIALSIFLTERVGFTDVEAGWIGGIFSSGIYLLPFATGAAADRMGFRTALLLAFALLACGYAGLALLPSKLFVPFSLVVIALGGSFVKPIITGTVARTSDLANRARAFSIFYMLVNIGSFSGKTVAKPVRAELGVGMVPLYSAGAALIALVLVALLYRPPETTEKKVQRLADTLRDMLTVLSNGRFLALVLITSGFWAIQGQLYASMPKYVIRLVGEAASPEWYANVNPLVVVCLVVPITQLVKRFAPVTSITVALTLIPCSALVMAFASTGQANFMLFGQALHPITVMMLLGIALQGLAECFLSPRYLEFASRQAPKGQEGLYMGYSNLNTFFAWLFGFIISGYLLQAFCPDPKTLSAAAQAQRLASLAGNGPMPAEYAHAHYLWFAFSAVGVTALIALLVFRAVTRRQDEAAAAQ